MGVKWNVALRATPFIGSDPKGPARASSAGEKGECARAHSYNSERSERQKSERSEDFFFGKKERALTLSGSGSLSLFP